MIRLMAIFGKVRERSSSSLVQSVLTFGLKAGAGLGSYLLFALVARMSDAEEFGHFSVLFSAAMMVGTAGSLGQQVFLVKELPRAVDALSEGAVYAFSLVAVLIGGSVAAAAFAAVVANGSSGHGTLLAMGGGVLCFAYAMSQATIGALRVRERVVFGIATRDLGWRIVTVVTLLAAVGFWPRVELDAATALMVMGLALLLIVLWHCVVLCRDLDISRLNLQFVRVGEWVKVTGGLTLVAVISSADLYIFSIVLGTVVNPVEVGPFFASLKTVEVINLFLMSVSLVVGPRVARAIAANDSPRVQAECNAAIVVQGLPAVVACAAVFAAAPYLLALFRPEFANYSNVLRILAIGVLVNALTGATVLMLQLVGLHWRQVAYQGGSLLLALALLPFLVGQYGLIGAAASFVLSKLMWNALAIHSIRKRIGVDPSCLGLLGTGALDARQSLLRLRGDILGGSI